MRSGMGLWLWVVGLLWACTGVRPVADVAPAPEEVVTSWEEGCEDTRSLVLRCREDDGEACAFFRCREAIPQEVLLAYRGGGPIYLPGASPAPRRWWGRAGGGWPRDTEPVLVFRFNRHLDPPPLPFVLPPGRWARHHLFPQERELREWFHSRGIPDIHQYTVLIPESVHVRLHGGGPRGGLWNQAWRDFKKTRFEASPEEIYRHAGELLYRFQLTGPIIPYHGGRPVR